MRFLVYILICTTFTSPSISGMYIWIVPNETRSDLHLILCTEEKTLGALELNTNIPQNILQSDEQFPIAFKNQLRTNLTLFINIVNFLIYYYAYEPLLELIIDLNYDNPSYLMRINILNILNKCLTLLSEFEDVEEVRSLRTKYYDLYKSLQFANSALIRQAESYYEKKEYTAALLTLSHINLREGLRSEVETYHRIRMLIFIQKGDHMHALHEAGLILKYRHTLPQPTLWVAKFIKMKYGDLSTDDINALLRELSTEAKTSAQHLKLAHYLEKNQSHQQALNHYMKTLDKFRMQLQPLQPPSPLTQVLIQALKNGLYLLLHESHVYNEQDTLQIHHIIRNQFNELTFCPVSPEEKKTIKFLKENYCRLCTAQ